MFMERGTEWRGVGLRRAKLLGEDGLDDGVAVKSVKVLEGMTPR